MMGHGWVTPRPDGAKAKCGGPGLCQVCAREKAALSGQLPPVKNDPPPMPAVKPPRLTERSKKYDEVERLLYEFLDAVLEVDPERHASIGIGRNIEGVGHLDLRLTWKCDS